MAWECLGSTCPGCSTCDPLRSVAKNVTPRRLHLGPRPHTASMMEPVDGALDRDVAAASNVIELPLDSISRFRVAYNNGRGEFLEALARVRARRNSPDNPEGA
jgi:hypothetical protein